MEWAGGMFWVISAAGQRQYMGASTTGITGVFCCNCKTEMSKKCKDCKNCTKSFFAENGFNLLIVMIRESGSLWIHNFYPFDIIIKADARSISHLFILLARLITPQRGGAKSSRGNNITVTRNKIISSYQIPRRGLSLQTDGGAEEDPSPVWLWAPCPHQPPIFPSQVWSGAATPTLWHSGRR